MAPKSCSWKVEERMFSPGLFRPQSTGCVRLVCLCWQVPEIPKYLPLGPQIPSFPACSGPSPSALGSELWSLGQGRSPNRRVDLNLNGEPLLSQA